MLQHAMKLSIVFLIAFILNGCGQDQPQLPSIDQYVSVPQKCVIEIVQDPYQEKCKVNKNMEQKEAVNEALQCQERNRIRALEAFDLQKEKAKICQ